MFQHLVVPVDGSAASWTAVRVAARLAQLVDGSVSVVTVVGTAADREPAQTELSLGLELLADLPVEPSPSVIVGHSVATSIGDVVEATNGAMVVMSSHGHGRSAAVLGSVADDLLRCIFGPIVVVGPDVAVPDREPSGTYLMPVDGSETSEAIVPIVEAWTVEFGGVPWVVEVIEPSTDTGDVMESAYPARLAKKMRDHIHRRVEFDVLHDKDAADGVVAYAGRVDADLIFATTHGRTGMERLRMGSVASKIVRHAPCPVVMYRPPHLVA